MVSSPSTFDKSFLQDLLSEPKALLLQQLADRVADFLGVRDLDTGLVDDAVKDELSGDTARNANGKGHGGVTTGDTVSLEGGGKDLLLTHMAYESVNDIRHLVGRKKKR